jgi:crotonobetainyl-CoA:carnitine CoA-transferase CaiB-like acyl-CoA transferase
MSQFALQDLTVLDLSRAYAGPFCAMLLADMGADVIKIEDPKVPDFSRGLPPFGKGPTGENSAYFAALNRSKRGMTLNLKHSAAVAIFKDLVRQADIVVENYSAGVMDRFGLSWETLHKVNPKLIMASLTCFGQDGPYAGRPGYDGMGQAMGGICSVNGPADGPPLRVGPPLGDSICALYAAIGILMALHSRSKTGIGQWVDISQQDSIYSLLEAALATYLLNGEVLTRQGSRHLYVGPYDIFPCKDGYVFYAGYLDHHFRKTCEIFGEASLADHPELGSLQARSRPEVLKEIIYPKLLAWFSRHTKRELEAMCAEQVPLCIVLDVGECTNDPQLNHRKMIESIEHPFMGTIRLPGIVTKLSATPGAIRIPPPTLGQHTSEILSDRLRLSASRIKELKAVGAI